MTWIVYEIEFLSDVDGRGPECCRSEIGRFENEEDAYIFVNEQNEWCEVDFEETY